MEEFSHDASPDAVYGRSEIPRALGITFPHFKLLEQFDPLLRRIRQSGGRDRRRYERRQLEYYVERRPRLQEPWTIEDGFVTPLNGNGDPGEERSIPRRVTVATAAAVLEVAPKQVHRWARKTVEFPDHINGSGLSPDTVLRVDGRLSVVLLAETVERFRQQYKARIGQEKDQPALPNEKRLQRQLLREERHHVIAMMIEEGLPVARIQQKLREMFNLSTSRIACILTEFYRCFPDLRPIGNMRRLSDEEREDMRRLRSEGKSIPEIAAASLRSKNAVWRALREDAAR